MRDAGDAWTFVGAADVGDPAACDGGVIGTLDHKKFHPVGQRLFDYGNLLGRQRADECQAERQPKESAWNRNPRTRKSLGVQHGARTASIRGSVNGEVRTLGFAVAGAISRWSRLGGIL